MTEEYAVGNLVERCETYLSQVALQSLAGAVSVLQMPAELIPMAEKVKLVDRCVDAVACIACKERHLSDTSKEVVADLTALRIDLFQRVLVAMVARGFQQYALGPILMLYAQQSLRGLEMRMEPRQEHHKRVVLETIVSLLPRENKALSVSFLSMLLRSAMSLETTVACRLDLEERMGLQLGQAVLDDLLLFHVDTVERIMTNYLECQDKSIDRVRKLMENYLAEIASDRKLSVSKFNNLAELVPEEARVTEDGMYRAIDIYLKAHLGLNDTERKKVCSLMDCQKLSREACAHAAQNDKLPVQTVVQVLYYEQQRLRDESPAPPKATINTTIPDELSKLKRQNQDLKLELVKLKMKLKMERPPPLQSADKPPLPRKSIINSVSKKLSRLYPFGITSTGAKGKTKPPKDRRHSIS